MKGVIFVSDTADEAERRKREHGLYARSRSGRWAKKDGGRAAAQAEKRRVMRELGLSSRQFVRYRKARRRAERRNEPAPVRVQDISDRAARRLAERGPVMVTT